eukprot:scaffold26135_cov72-Skeletonema_dohrnii-CCMP3373.AAC.1
MAAYTKAMSRLILLTSCIIISLCSRGVTAFIPSSTPRTSSFGMNNLPPLHLKGSSTKHTTIPTSTQQHIHHTKSSLRAATSSNDNDNNSNNKSSKQTPIKKRKMSISKQSLTPAQKSSTQQPNNNAADDDEQRAYNELMPKTGYSLADSLEQSVDNKELFETVLTPIGGVYSGGNGVFGEDEEFEYDADGFPIGIKSEQTTNEEEGDGHDGIARIDTISNFGGVEPVRWIVSVGDEKDGAAAASHVMIDLPPYSDKLANEIRQFMNPDLNTTTTATTTEEVKR